MRFMFECRHLVSGCEGKVNGKSKEEVLERAAEHARERHGMETLEPGTIEMVRAGIIQTDE